jgi:hypothetical protein
VTIFIHQDLQKHHIKQLEPKPDKVLIFPPLTGKGFKNTVNILSIAQLENETGRSFSSSGHRNQLNVNFFTHDQASFETSVMESILRIPGFMETFKVPPPAPKKIKRIKSSQCVACQEEGVELIVLNCGHECMCQKCSNEWEKSCPLCRKKIKLIIY